jgi:excisionase family DNA binding protein
MKALKSIEQAAGLLGISPWTVRSYIRSGRLRSVRIGRRVLLAEHELERLVSEGQEQIQNEQDSGNNPKNGMQEVVDETR